MMREIVALSLRNRGRQGISADAVIATAFPVGVPETFGNEQILGALIGAIATHEKAN